MSFDEDASVECYEREVDSLEDAIVWELIALSAAKPPEVFHPQSFKSICNAAKWSTGET